MAAPGSYRGFQMHSASILSYARDWWPLWMKTYLTSFIIKAQSGGDNCKQRGSLMKFFWWGKWFHPKSLFPQCCRQCRPGRLRVGSSSCVELAPTAHPPPPRTLMGCVSRFFFPANSRPGSLGHFGEEAALNSLWSLGGHLRGDHSSALTDEQFHSWGELMSFSQKGPSWLPDWLQSPGDRLICTALASFQGWRRTPYRHSLMSLGHCNNVPRTGWLQVAEMRPLSFGAQKSRYPSKTRGTFPSLFRCLGVACYPWGSLAHICFPRPLPLWSHDILLVGFCLCV